MYKVPASPGTPLFPVSPERANRQSYKHVTPTKQESPSYQDRYSTQCSQYSPSMPAVQVPGSLANAANGHSRNNSDVQGKVAQFNILARDAAQRRKDNEAALTRAVLGREEAEMENQRLRHETQKLRVEQEESKSRERKLALRLQNISEELQQAHEKQTQSRAIYEKEVRRAKKEAFNSSSTLVKAQEDLKTARNRFTLMREDCEQERLTRVAREQENQDLDYQLNVLHERFSALEKKLAFTEEMRDALKKASKADEVARLAAEGQVALPPPNDDEEASQPARKRKRAVWALCRERWDFRPGEDVPWFEHPIRGWGPVDKFMENEIAERMELEERMQIRRIAACNCTASKSQPQQSMELDRADELRKQVHVLCAPHDERPLTPAELAQAIADGTFEPGKRYREALARRRVARRRLIEKLETEDCTPKEEPASNALQSDVVPHEASHESAMIEDMIPISTASIPVPESFDQPDLESFTQVIPSFTIPSCALTSSADTTKPDETRHFPATQLRTQAVSLNDEIPRRSAASIADREQSRFPSTPRALEQRPARAPRTISANTVTAITSSALESLTSPSVSGPGTISREDALEQIRLRRGRARSMAASRAASPVKPMKDIVWERSDQMTRVGSAPMR